MRVYKFYYTGEYTKMRRFKSESVFDKTRKGG